MKKEQTPACCPLGHILSSPFRILFALLLTGIFLLPVKASAQCDPAFSASASGTQPSACGACDGTATVNPTGGTPPYSYLWSTGATTQSIGAGESGTELCINAGGLEFIASTGDTFIQDYYYNPGNPATTAYSNFAAAIDGTTDDSLYQSERNIVAAGGTMTYNIPVANGPYDVELHFAELYYGVINMTPPFTGKRKFDVSIEGVLVLDDYDINADVGPAKAAIKSFTTSVADGMLDIAFTSVVNRAKVNAICVKPSAGFITPSGGLCAGTYSVTVTDANGCEANGEVILNDPGCNDENSCTADECISGECNYTPIICDDSDACTDDFCDSASGCYSLPHSCDDSDLCTEDLCDISTGCYHLTLICSDADDCTDDHCDAGTGCYNTPVNCDDGDACTIDACESGTELMLVSDVCSHTPIDCNDNDECTEDTCDDGVCVNTEIPGCNDPCNNVICDDEDDCTIDVCDAGDCIYIPILCNDDDLCTQDACIAGDCYYFLDNCDDGDACTEDICLGSGFCDHLAIVCDDSDACTDDACDAGQCVFTAIICDDADECTSDACDNGLCVYTAISCDDGDVCTTDDCDEGCIHETINCDDGDACTIDACESGTAVTIAIGGCTHYLIDCNDNDECTEDLCDNGVCVNTEIPGCNDPCNNVICDDENDCTTDACDAGNCINTPILCNDDDLCTDDACDAGQCVFTAIICDDADECTSDACDNGLCAYTAISCDDGDACTIDACESGTAVTIAIGGCTHYLIDCNDNDECTEDLCDNGVCVNTEIPGCNDPCNNVICDDENDCTTDACDAGNCVHTPILCNDDDLCTDDACDAGQCVFTAIICDDADECTSDACDNGLCVYTAISCDDGDACTTDDCDEGCIHTPILCDDGNACTSNLCDNGQCVYTPILCDDNDDCTTDACDNGQCVYTPILCDDSDVCTTDNCASGRCNFRPVNCDDNNACTIDACDAGCTNTPIDCNDNDACTEDICSNGICGHINICNPCTLEVISFTLVNSLSDLDISPLEDGDVINLFYTPNVNVRANLCVEPVGSVKFNLNGPTYKVEGATPYALAGDNPTGNYNKWNVSVGEYTITAIPYSGPSASGTQGISKSITITVINQEIACLDDADCDDSNDCTTDVCQSGQCSNAVVDCNDNDACTADDCNSECIHTVIICDDGNLCTDDACNSLSGCEFSEIAGCCLSAADCNDGDVCTIDACENNQCEYEAAPNEPAYLHVINTGKSWKKLKLGYSSTSLYIPKQNVIAGGNNELCITLRGNAATEWNKIQVRPQGSVSAPVSLGGYGLGTSFTEICIPLAAFGGGVDFTQLTLIEIPYSNGAGAFEIDIQKIEFRGGATPFLWFGETKTDNKHDSGSNGALIATLVEGSPCGGSSKMSASNEQQLNSASLLSAYPNPFSDKLNIEFSLPEDAHVKLEIFNTAGQRIAQLFEGNVNASVLNKFEFPAENLSEGMLIYRLQTEKETFIGKAVMIR